MPQERTDPVKDDDGRETHPAFGLATVHRVSSSPGQVLFQSDVRHGELHTLIVHEVVRLPDGHFDDGELDYDIEHPPSCAQEDYGQAGRFKFMAWTCDVASHVIEGGLESSLGYSGTPITEPGTYQIQSWGRKAYDSYNGADEYDGGVGVVEPAPPEA